VCVVCVYMYVCMDGWIDVCMFYISVSNLNTMCGDRLWAFERVVGAFLEDFDDREERNVQTKTECEKLCLFETGFTCRYEFQSSNINTVSYPSGCIL